MKRLIYVVIALLIVGAIIDPSLRTFGVLTLGATLSGGILGPVKGKIGGMVGFVWKGIPVARAWVKPFNPQSIAQTAQRDRMTAMVAAAQAVYSSIITTYWDPFAVKMSGYNSFVKYNIKVLAATTFYWTVSNVLSRGNLYPVAITSAVLADNEVTFVLDDTVAGNGLATDGVDIFVINKETNALYSNVDTLTRADAGGVVDCGSESDASKLIAFSLAKRGTGSTYVISNSDSLQVTT